MVGGPGSLAVLILLTSAIPTSPETWIRRNTCILFWIIFVLRSSTYPSSTAWVVNNITCGTRGEISSWFVSPRTHPLNNHCDDARESGLKRNMTHSEPTDHIQPPHVTTHTLRYGTSHWCRARRRHVTVRIRTSRGRADFFVHLSYDKKKKRYKIRDTKHHQFVCIQLYVDISKNLSAWIESMGVFQRNVKHWLLNSTQLQCYLDSSPVLSRLDSSGSESCAWKKWSKCILSYDFWCKWNPLNIVVYHENKNVLLKWCAARRFWPDPLNPLNIIVYHEHKK